MTRTIKRTVKGEAGIDGAGVHLDPRRIGGFPEPRL